MVRKFPGKGSGKDVEFPKCEPLYRKCQDKKWTLQKYPVKNFRIFGWTSRGWMFHLSLEIFENSSQIFGWTESTCGLVTRISLIIWPYSPQIHAASPFRCWGFSVPQTSVDPSVLCRATEAVSDACKLRGIVGYFSIDFVTFIDPKSVGTLTVFCTISNNKNKLNKLTSKHTCLTNSGSNNNNTS